jgi:2-polyprenyl-3-methyl-5-hydroxy-6-metoxy-1,4-benzoquinol methylase
MVSEYQDYRWSDMPVQSTGYIYPILRNMLQRDKGKRILDMGCGNGKIANLLIADGFDVMGIEASTTGVEVANQKNPGRIFVHDVSNDKLPVELLQRHFDIVISTEVIEHLYAPRAYMSLVRKTLQSTRVTSFFQRRIMAT